MSGYYAFSRRQFLETTTAIIGLSTTPNVLFVREGQQQKRSPSRQRYSRPKDHHADGKSAAVTSTSNEASHSALWALGQGGNAADAYMTAALTQTVVEHGLTSIGGDFARNYVRRAATDKGRITMQDMAGWRELGRTVEDRLEGNYRGYQVSSAGLIMYALHLAEALDLKSSGPAKSNPNSSFAQYRIMEEVFLSTSDYSKDTHEQFVSPEYARKRSDFVLNSPLRKLTFDKIFNTCFLVVRDRDGNIAWGTHSINTPTAFGAGIMVDGVYAAHAMNRKHVSGSGGSAAGISTSFALFRDSKPRMLVGSPGFGFVHGHGSLVPESLSGGFLQPKRSISRDSDYHDRTATSTSKVTTTIRRLRC